MCEDNGDLKDIMTELKGLKDGIQEISEKSRESSASNKLAFGVGFIGLAVGFAGIVVADTDAEFYSRIIGVVLAIIFLLIGICFVSESNWPKCKEKKAGK